MRRELRDVIIGIKRGLPRLDRIKAIARPCKAGSNPLKIRRADPIRAAILSKCVLDAIDVVVPLLGICRLIPGCRAFDTLRRCLEKVWLISHLPVEQAFLRKRLASIRNRFR